MYKRQDTRVVAQRDGLAFHGDFAFFDDVSVIGIFERNLGVLLNKKDCHAELAVDVHDFFKKLRHDHGRKTLSLIPI